TGYTGADESATPASSSAAPLQPWLWGVPALPRQPLLAYPLPACAACPGRAPPCYYYFVSFDLHEVSFDKKGGYPWIYTPVQPRCPSWTSFWPPSRCASVARRARPPWSAP